MDNLQNEISARVEAFVAEITELARAAAYQTLNSALEGGQPVSGRGVTTLLRGRRGGKRTADEIAQMADVFLAHVTANPGQRMEHIAKKLGVATPELMLPVRKLLADGKLRVEGQKRATQYHPAESEGIDAGQTSASRSKRSGTKVRRGKGRPKRKS